MPREAISELALGIFLWVMSSIAVFTLVFAAVGLLWVGRLRGAQNSAKAPKSSTDLDGQQPTTGR